MKNIILGAVLALSFALSGIPAFAALTVTPSLPGGNSLTESAQASVSVSVINTGNSAESNIVVGLASSPLWFSVVTDCSLISSLQSAQSGTSSCIITPTGTGSGLSMTATATSSGGTSGSGQVTGITVNPSASTLTAQISSDSSAEKSSRFYAGVTVTAPSSTDSTNVITTASISGGCIIDTSYVSASQNIGNVTKGTSRSPTNWKITAPSSAGSCVFSVSATSDNTGSAAPSKTVTITGGDGNTGGSTGGTTGGAAGASNTTNKTSEKKAEKQEDKKTPPGLANNTKLQAAIEKVLAKGKLSQSAIDNLNRLADLIKLDVSDDKTFKTENGKSTITEKLKYSGAKKIKNFMIHAKLPKEFAAHAGDVTVSTTGTVGTVESDPEFLVTFAEALPNQEFAITYAVNAVADKSVLDSASSQAYAESLEDIQQPEKSIIGTIQRQNYVTFSIMAIMAIIIAGIAITRWKRIKPVFGKVKKKK